MKSKIFGHARVEVLQLCHKMDFWDERGATPLVEFVEYHVYGVSQEVSLMDVLVDIRRICKELCSDYFWCRQGPVFEFKDDPTLPHIYGRFETGDSIDDEWMMVFLLMQLTKNIPDIIATIHDVDGEFLLIEAAEVLPKWLDKVESSINRVFVKEGKVVIIPRNVKVDNLVDALNNISLAKHYPLIQKQVEVRAIEAYQQPKHHARLSLPEKAWRLLHKDPSLTSKAVDALYASDSELQYKAQASNIFPPKDMIQTTVRFSRSAFAQLACQPFEPLPVSEWSKEMHTATTSEELGMKLACGLEMLCTNFNDITIPNETVPPNDRPEGSLQWMELDECTFDQDFLQPNPVDKIAEKFEHSMRTVDSGESETGTSDDSFLMENLSDIETASSDDDTMMMTCLLKGRYWRPSRMIQIC